MVRTTPVILRPSPALGDKLRLAIWKTVHPVLFRPTPLQLHGWRRWLLRRLGAMIARDALVYPGCYIHAPWNLVLGSRAVLGDGVSCYNVALVTLEEGAIVSARANLCSASCDVRNPTFTPRSSAIRLGANSWVAKEAFIGPGVTVGKGAVVGACAIVRHDVAPWSVTTGDQAQRVCETPRCAGRSWRSTSSSSVGPITRFCCIAVF